MNVTETTLASNPSSDSRLAQTITPEQAAKNLLDLAQCLQSTVQQAAQNGESFDQTERAVLESVLQMGHQAMQLFVSLQGDGDLGGELEADQGKTLQ